MSPRIDNEYDVALTLDYISQEKAAAYDRDTGAFLAIGPRWLIIQAVCYALLERGYAENTIVQFYQRIRSKDPHTDMTIRPELMGPRVVISESLLRAWETHADQMRAAGFDRVSRVDPETPAGKLGPP